MVSLIVFNGIFNVCPVFNTFVISILYNTVGSKAEHHKNRVYIRAITLKFMPKISLIEDKIKRQRVQDHEVEDKRGDKCR